MSALDAHYDTYAEMAAFLQFDDADAARLKGIAPVFAIHGPALTDAFYTSLLAMERTASIVEGRVDALKRTHTAWMGELFAGEYGRPFFEAQYRIGQVHVVQNINPEYVEGVMNVLRIGGRRILVDELGATPETMAAQDSLVKILDLSLMTINLAYADERLERISSFTGMSRRLIENCVKNGKKKKKKA
jgi:hemoglobin-like flavoprotein